MSILPLLGQYFPKYEKPGWYSTLLEMLSIIPPIFPPLGLMDICRKNHHEIHGKRHKNKRREAAFGNVLARAHLPPNRCRLNLRSDIRAESGGIANPCRQFLVIHQYSLLGKVSGNVLRTTWTARRTSGGRYSPWRNPGSSFSCGYWDRGWLQIEAVGAMLLMGKPC